MNSLRPVNNRIGLDAAIPHQFVYRPLQKVERPSFALTIRL